MSLLDLQDTHRFAAPDLDPILCYRGLYALSTTSKGGRALRATHLAGVLIGGSRPVWGVWLVSGKFVRFAGSRRDIEEAYPKLVWRRKMATYSLVDLTDKSVDTRRSELREIYRRPLPQLEGEDGTCAA